MKLGPISYGFHVGLLNQSDQSQYIFPFRSLLTLLIVNEVNKSEGVVQI